MEQPHHPSMTSAPPSPPTGLWKSFISPWNQFFHEPEVPYALAMIRIIMPWVMLTAVLPRWFVSRDLYSREGVPTPIWDMFSVQPFLPILPAPLVVALYSALIVSFVMVSLGWKTRTSLTICLILYPYFGMLDMVSTMTKYTVISIHLILLLLCSECGQVWSLDAWFKARQSDITPLTGLHACPRWPRRLVQLLIGIVYFGAAITKLNSERFLTGEHLTFWMLADMNHPHPLGHWLSLRPALVMPIALLTVLWEFLFLFLAWKGSLRWGMLAIGILFHLATMATLGLYLFPFLYLTCYLAFLDEQEAKQLGTWVARQLHTGLSRISIPGWQPRSLSSWGQLSAFGVILTASALIGVEAEARLGASAKYFRHGPQPLEPLSEQRVRELLRNDLNLTPEDKVFRLDVGSKLLGNVVANHQTTFRPGEQLLLQCHFIPPHEDLYIEALLLDSEKRILDRQGHICPREDLRSLFRYHVTPDWPAGTYTLHVRLDGHAAARQQITITQ